jgi:Mg2+ and Co2+ transporter CorA
MIELTNEAFRVIALNWGFFLDDAEKHVTNISSQCIGSQKLSTEGQLHFTHELHQLTPVWGQVSRRLAAAQKVINALRDHPFYQSTESSEENSEFLLKFRATIDEHQERTKALREQTSALISLVLNIALLNESTAAIQESRASNDLALKVHRITIISFIFFPLSLSMVSILHTFPSLTRK